MKNWKKNMAAVMLSTSLLTSAFPYPLYADGTTSAAASTAAYKLTDTLNAEVKSVINEQLSGKTRLGAVIRLHNTGTELTRVPEYEVRVESNAGVTYTLRPSAGNPTVVLPQEKVELSYMIVVNRVDQISLSAMTWVRIDDFKYPIVETKVLSIPISSMEWHGSNAAVTDSSWVRSWGESFTIPVLSPALEFTPVNLNDQNTDEGPVTVVTLLAENKGTMKETIPEFRLDGKSDQKVYTGRRVKQESKPVVTLDPGEKQQVYFAIPTESGARLKSVDVVTPETFIEADQSKVEYAVGRMNIQLPDNANAPASANAVPMNDVNKPIAFDPFSKFIPAGVKMYMVELHVHEGEGDGYKTLIAKFKLENQSDNPLPVPNFQAELLGSDGKSYKGTRQKTVAQSLTPNLGYVISYSFIMPNTETGENLRMKLLDGESAYPFSIPIATFGVYAQKEDNESAINMYPFRVKLKDWSKVENIYYGGGKGNYSYRLKLDLDIEREENIVVDQNFSKLKVELADSLGRILDDEDIPFTGVGRLTSGWQSVSFENLRIDQFDSNFIIRIYETIDTPFGEAKRLVKTLTQ
ncbi:hypothetical protein [Paenibacillus hamazuiensis]|uniref:hypothetical protein n=1 Tax=Paenibacillus hamazuiensis TaxID=2936508 RepID=UPI00200BFC43|nr:hypothetical protein [Paenibacillus hamazuiensis]